MWTHYEDPLCRSHRTQRRWDILGAPQGDENCHWEMSGLQVQLLAEVGENQEVSPSPCQGWKDTVYVPKQDLQRNDASSFVENLKFFISMQVLRSLL